MFCVALWLPAMAIRTQNIDTALILAAESDGDWASPDALSTREPCDCRWLYEREHARAERERARAEAAEGRAEKLRWAEVSARSDAGSWKSRFEASRRRLEAAAEEAKQARHAAQNALSLQAEVARLSKLLWQAGVEPSKRGTMLSLRREVARLRQAEQVSKTRGEASEARLSRLRTIGKPLSKRLSDVDAQLRKALRRSRRQKAAINSLAKENGRLRKAVSASQNGIETLQAQLAKLRASGAVLSKRLYGRKSEQQDKPRSRRQRGQQRGALGHGRTQRPGLEERTEEINPPADVRVCSCCGKPYATTGAEASTLVEIEVKAHTRRIVRPRWRRTCECAASPREVSASPVPRLFVNTSYGISVWSRFLFERYACLRPLHRVAVWLSDQGLPISPGTLADSAPRFVPLFESVADAILAHQNAAAVRHADETSWRVQALRETGRSSRAWLWTSVSGDAVYFHIDPSRSAEAAHKLFDEPRFGTVIVCDRYSAYKRLARLLGGLVTLAFCWAHMRRDFIECAAGQVRLTDWCREWIGRIASIYRLNDARLEHYNLALAHQTPTFDAAQTALKEALNGLFADAERELAGLPEPAREGKPLRSLLNHREGLSVFIDRPRVPLDNNKAERFLRGPAIGRRLSFGSDSETGARFTALMYSVIGTLTLNGIDVLRWLTAWLTACAQNGGRPPDDLLPWLPWSMSGEHRRELMAPG